MYPLILKAAQQVIKIYVIGIFTIIIALTIMKINGINMALIGQTKQHLINSMSKIMLLQYNFIRVPECKLTELA